MFRVEVYKGKTLGQGAEIALKNRLWVSGWALRGDLADSYSLPNAQGEIAIGFLDDIPVTVVAHDGIQVMAFCRKSLRKRGYASQCLAMVTGPNLRADTGIKGSDEFWRKNKVPRYIW